MGIGTVIITLVLVGIVIIVIASMVRDRKKGKASCCGGCAHCAMAGMCHKAGKESGVFSTVDRSCSHVYLHDRSTVAS